MKYCQQDILKTNWARALKLGELIEDDEQITWSTLEKVWIILSELCPFRTGIFVDKLIFGSIAFHKHISSFRIICP